MNTLKMINVLLASIDNGSLTAAGEILGYTQSSMTQMVKAFEDEVGFPLLIKTKRGVEPTEECKALLPSMRSILLQEEKIYQEIDSIRGIHKGKIRIGTFVSTSTSWLPQLLAYFQANYPDVVFEVEESGQDEMLRGIQNGSLDIALMSQPETDAVDFIPLLEDPLMVVFSEKHNLSCYDFVPVKELAKHPMILTYQSYDRDVQKIFDDAEFAPDVKYYFKDDFAVLTTVQYGLGIAVLPELIIDKFPGNYDCRMLDPEAYRTLGVGIRSEKEAGPLARFVIDFLKQNVK